MATIRTNPAVTSITFSTTGVVAGANGVFAGLTALEATACVQGFQRGGQPSIQSALSGAGVITLPSVITSITINGNVYNNIGNGNIIGVAALDINALMVGACGQPFQLVTG